MQKEIVFNPESRRSPWEAEPKTAPILVTQGFPEGKPSHLALESLWFSLWGLHCNLLPFWSLGAFAVEDVEPLPGLLSQLLSWME